MFMIAVYSWGENHVKQKCIQKLMEDMGAKQKHFEKAMTIVRD